MRHAFADAHIHSDGDSDGNGHVHSDGDSNGNAYAHSDANGNCDSNGEYDPTAAAFTDGTASTDTVSASPTPISCSV